MAAIANRTRIGLRETGHTITIPDNNKAKLMYYLDCMCSVLEMDNTGEIRRLRDFRNYHLIDANDLTKLLIFALLLSPDELNGKCIFHDDAMCGNSSNKFFELSAVNTTLLVSESIVVGGERRRVQKIMTYKLAWIRDNYVVPLASFQRQLIQIRNGLQAGSSSSRALPAPRGGGYSGGYSSSSDDSGCCCVIL